MAVGTSGKSWFSNQSHDLWCFSCAVLPPETSECEASCHTSKSVFSLQILPTSTVFQHRPQRKLYHLMKVNAEVLGAQIWPDYCVIRSADGHECVLPQYSAGQCLEEFVFTSLSIVRLQVTGPTAKEGRWHEIKEVQHLLLLGLCKSFFSNMR